tara:strand:- start:374 stop:610 length:237 start_codon:yes stop_codon:yes gene_type:complete
MALRKDGSGAIVSLDKGFHLLDFESGDWQLLYDPEPGMGTTRLNFNVLCQLLVTAEALGISSLEVALSPSPTISMAHL